MRKFLVPALLLALLVPAAAHADEKADLARMAQEHQHDKPVASPAAMEAPAQPVDGAEVTYGEVGGKPLRGYAARPKSAKGPLPGVIVIHEWWGLNDNIRAMTRRLAGEGYEALAVDLYGGSHADDPRRGDEADERRAAEPRPGPGQPAARRRLAGEPRR